MLMSIGFHWQCTLVLDTGHLDTFFNNWQFSEMMEIAKNIYANSLLKQGARDVALQGLPKQDSTQASAEGIS